MPKSLTGWLTPDTPASATTECRRIFIPDNIEFVGAVNGALLELTKAYNWEQFGTMSAEDAAAAMYDMWIAFMESNCTLAVATGWRVNPNGNVEFTDNGGLSWSNADEEVWLPTEERTEPTPQERRCLASANAVAVLRQTYVETLIEYDLNNDVYYGAAALGAIMGLLFLGLLVPVSGIAVVNVLIAFTIEGFAVGWAALELLTDDDWTPEYDDFLTCLLYENSTDTDGVVTFDWKAVRDNINNPEVDLGITIWNFYILSIVGQEGLNNAGGTTSVEEADCDECEECDIALNGAGLNGWTPALVAASPCSEGDLEWDSTLDRVIRTGQCSSAGGLAGYVVVGMVKAFDFNIENIKMNYSIENGTCAGASVILRILDSEGDEVLATPNGTIVCGVDNFVELNISPSLPAGEYYVSLEASNGGTVPPGGYASINGIEVCGSLA